ncbi:DUF4890 domain-containing protein [Bacteroides sp.]
MKRIAFFMVTLFLMGSMAMAQGQRGEHKKMTPKERAERMTERMAKEYSLNDTQKKQLLELNLAQSEKMGDRMSMRPNKGGKKDGKKAPEMTKEQREKMRAERKAANDEYNAQLQKIMTKEQYDSYIKKQAEREQRMKEGRRQKK